ncbi:DUF5123 domain-containing protein [Chryseosolibacter histidini]|uniref:DUF5123 domain-containing protein n=1 Tax=Chryseosolibacter histidini TaxID=2782349 RepID=UPI0020B280F8|nr:DUF5123 domain-containing protein [Chryseosolibacter histidini]
MFFACDDEKVYPQTRLFRPVLNKDLSADKNTIIVNMAKMKGVVSYTIEVSRDTFKTIDYTIESDQNYLVLNSELLKGDPLFWNMLYQVRATAHAEDPQYDSRISDLGSVRTERFPSVLKEPATYDVTDVAARVTWTVEGEDITTIKIFAGNDLKLTTPLREITVPEADRKKGETFAVQGLTPSTKYQVAIYAQGTLRGWVEYTTLTADIDPASPGVVDLRAATDPLAVANAVTAAASGSTILVKRGSVFYMPTVALNKSITIRAAHGFGAKRARLFNKNGNWNIAGGSTIEFIRFIDLELRGGDFGGTYVFNPAVNNISVSELLFENCVINTMRGVMRLRNNNVVVDNYKFINCQLDSIGSYGLLTADQPVSGSPSTTARVNNIVLQNSTFNRFQFFISSYNNSQSITIENCTFSNIITSESGNYIFRYRGGDGNNNVINGISIKNSVFGPGWNTGNTATNNVRGKEGLPSTPIQVVNTYVTNDWDFVATYEIPGLRSTVYGGNQSALWVSPLSNNFSFKDNGFAGRFSTGDPRWRTKR